MVLKDFFLKVFLMLGLLGSFANPFHLLSNVLLLKGLAVKVKIAPIIFIFIVICLIIIKMNFFGILSTVNIARYYFGFLLFFLVFSSLNLNVFSRINVSNFIFRVFVVSTIIEFTYINFIGDASHLHFLRCGRDCDDWQYKTFFGFYRAFGIGASPSISSALIVVAFIKSNLKYKWPLLLIALSMHLSGFGVVALMLLLLVRYPMLGFLFIAIIILISLNVESESNKIGWFYLNVLFWYKEETWMMMLAREDFNFLTGNLSIFTAGGDFGYQGITNDFGLIGLFNLLIATIFMGRGLFIEKLIVLLSGLHYHLLFSVPGQILFAWVVFESQKLAQKK